MFLAQFYRGKDTETYRTQVSRESDSSLPVSMAQMLSYLRLFNSLCLESIFIRILIIAKVIAQIVLTMAIEGLENMLICQSPNGYCLQLKVHGSEVGLSHACNSLLYLKTLLGTQWFFKHSLDQNSIRRSYGRIFTSLIGDYLNGIHYGEVNSLNYK